MKRTFPLILIYSLSLAVFGQPYIAVISPNGGEQIAVGSRFTITWQSAEIAGDVLIEYSADNGQNWVPVSYEPVDNTGMFDWWDIPDAISRDCVISISSADDQSVYDTSDSTFAVYQCLLAMMTDVNHDCYINIKDLAWVAEEWLVCGNPLDDQCILPDCQTGFGDCDGDMINGCETDLLSDVNNCGLCGQKCEFANAEADCIGGNCVMGNCLPGYEDVNGDPADGCEYNGNCQWISDTDEPDNQFIDADCDGIDGETDKAIFVDGLRGADSNSGLDMQNPKRTIQAGINAAAAVARDYLLISRGTYNTDYIQLASGVEVHGGYDAGAGWSRSNSNTTSIIGGPKTVRGSLITEVRLSFLEINSSDTQNNQSSSYAVWLDNSTNVSLANCTVRAGSGGNGTGGNDGNRGRNGSNGQPGVKGCENSTVFCSTCDKPIGGAGGSSPAGRRGGKGGDAGLGDNNGEEGDDGYYDYNGGSPGEWPNTSSCSSQRISGYHANADNGTPGAYGNNGAPGMSFGTVSLNGFIASNGSNGTDGQHGEGGGGGGGGRGGDYSCDSYGSSGGGGGGGGERGTRGYGGTGAGGSFGVWLFLCENVNISGCDISTSIGGTGGAGGTGGDEGAGGTGGRGGEYGGADEQDDGGCGGWGGDGGRGGRGGHGGGGAGGPSVGIVNTDGNVATSNNTYNISPGGMGGTSLGNPGERGISTSIHSPL